MHSSEPEGASSDERLDQIETQWSLLRLSREDTISVAGPARKALLLRYNRAIRSYVGALMQDDQSADEVSQDVMVRLLKGDFARADAARGRFRDLLKVSVRNMVHTFWQKQNRRRTADFDVEQLGAPAADAADEREWIETWRKGVLDMAWKSLEDFQRSNPGSLAYTVLRLRTDHPDDDSQQLAERVSAAAGKSLNAAALRQQLRRARLRLAQLLVEELARGLAEPTPEAVEEELAELGLWEYVRDFLPDDWRETGRLAAHGEE